MAARLPASFYLQVLFCAALWGSAFPVIKNSYAALHIDSYGEQLVFAGSRFLLAGLMVLPFWESYFADFNRVSLLVTLYLAFLSATAFTLWNRLIEQYNPNLLASFRFLIPLMGIVESVLFIPGENLRPGIVVGGAIVLASLLVIARVKEVPAGAMTVRP